MQLPSRNCISTVLALGALLAFPVSGLSQGVSFGVRVGVTSTSFVSDPGWNRKAGALVGAFGAVRVHDFLMLQPEVMLSRAGAHFPGINGIFSAPAEDVGLIYLQMPILARLRLAGHVPTSVRPTLHMGPMLSVMLSCKYAIHAEDRFSDAALGIPVPCASRNPVTRGGGRGPPIGVDFAQPRKWDFGIVVGTGLEADWGSSVMMLDVRYNRGFRTVDRLEPEARNEAFTIIVAWSHPLRL